MVNDVDKNNRTALWSPYMPPEDAKRTLETVLRLLEKGASWLDMYKIVAEACRQTTAREKELLHHGFQAPRMLAAGGNLVRLDWAAQGEVVRQHKEHLETTMPTMRKLG